MRLIKDIVLDDVKHYLRLDSDFIEDDNEILMYMGIAKSYLMKRCSMTEKTIDDSSILVAPYLLLVSEMYSNKSGTIPSGSKVSWVIDNFITIESPII